MTLIIHWILGISATAIAGFVGWSIASILTLRADIATLRLHVSEEYLKKDDINELTKEVRILSRVIYEIAGKLGIQVRG